MIIAKSGQENYYTEVSNGITSIASDVTGEKGGNGNNFRPHELLCSGFASCLNITVRMVLERKNIDYDQVVVKVDLDSSDETKTKFFYDIEIIGDIPEKKKQEIINIAKNCPVRRTLERQIEFEAM